MFDHAVIVSSDGDFTQLAIHIRENGRGIDGIGEDKSTEFLQSAFDKFSVVPAAPCEKGSRTEAFAGTSKEMRPLNAAKRQNMYSQELDTALLRRVFNTVSKDSQSAEGASLWVGILAADHPKYKKGIARSRTSCGSQRCSKSGGIATVLAK